MTILIVGSIAFLFSIQQINRSNKNAELTKLLEVERTKLEISVNKEIEIVLKMAGSPQIKSYFEQPFNLEFKRMAENEINAFHRALDGSTFWINDVDKIFYSSGAEPFRLDATDSVNYWYPLTLYETQTYNFNINYNPDLNVTNLWINAPVLNAQGKAVGILGIGIDISKFVNAVYNNYSGDACLYFFNAGGEITGARSVDLVATKKNIMDELKSLDDDILARAKGLSPNAIQTFTVESGQAAVVSIPTLQWYAIAVLHDSIGDFKSSLTVFFFVVILVIAFILVLSNIFISGLFTQLQQTMASLEAASKAKSNFLANMSHEIRTPMNSIFGFSDLILESGDVSPKVREYLNNIKASSGGLLKIITDLLDLSKIETGKMVIENIPFDLSDVCKDCNDAVSLSAWMKGVELIYSCDPAFRGKLLGDPVKLRQVFFNLLSNAIKFTDHGKVRLIVVADNISPEEITASFAIEDTGIGMNEKQISEVLKPFSQADDSSIRKYGGTGLGLPIAKNFIELMGGELQIVSVPGLGSKFSFDLTFLRCK
ncbi:MAG: ATP-binding protein [Fibromonadales bacterium]|nr:ATP-binding protein [Fibromonadales bacterium]